MGMSNNPRTGGNPMKGRAQICTLILLSAMSVGRVLADEPARLPDLGSALQARIDGRVAASLNTGVETRQEASVAAATPSPDRRTHPQSEPRLGRTDEPGWKPYHSAL
jgi:hypothetical protein